MSVTLYYEFDTDADYSYDPTYLEIVDGVARVKLAAEADKVFTQGFDSAAGFVFDPSLVEVAGGSATQLRAAPQFAGTGIDFSKPLGEANWNFNQSRLPTLVGGASVASGVLDLTGESNKSVYYDRTRTQTGGIKFLYKPNYSGAPSSTIMFGGQEVDGTSAGTIRFLQYTDGSIRVLARDDANAVVANNAQIAPNPNFVADQWYEILLQWDCLDGEFSVYIDKQRVGSHSISPWTISATSGRGHIGSSTPYVSDGTYDDVLFFTQVYVTETSYVTDLSVPKAAMLEAAVDLPTFVYGGLGSIQAFQSMTATTSGVTVKYAINGKYWDGGAWSLSDKTYAKANTLAEIVAQLGSLQVSDSIIITAVFPEGDIIGSINYLDFTYTGQRYYSGYGMTPHAGLNITDLCCIDEHLGEKPANTELKYVIEVDTIQYWWDGDSWEPSAGYAESNTMAEIKNEVATLPILPTGSFVRPKVYFETDGQSPVGIDRISFTATYDINPISSPRRTYLYGNILDIVGIKQTAKAWLRVVNEKTFFVEGSTIVPQETVAEANAEGIASLVVVASGDVGHKYRFFIDYTDSTGKVRKVDLGYSVAPNENISNIANLPDLLSE